MSKVTQPHRIIWPRIQLFYPARTCTHTHTHTHCSRLVLTSSGISSPPWWRRSAPHGHAHMTIIKLGGTRQDSDIEKRQKWCMRWQEKMSLVGALHTDRSALHHPQAVLPNILVYCCLLTVICSLWTKWFLMKPSSLSTAHLLFRKSISWQILQEHIWRGVGSQKQDEASSCSLPSGWSVYSELFLALERVAQSHLHEFLLWNL